MANININVEPLEGGKVTFLPMAPITAESKARGRILLRLEVTNTGPDITTIESIEISFPGSVVPSDKTDVYYKTDSGNNPMVINPTETAKWWFQEPKDHIVFDLPAPTKIKLSVECPPYDTYYRTYSLVPHFNHFKGAPYLFPASHEDLDLGEFWYMNGCSHSMGEQGFAYDTTVWGIDHKKDSYGELKPNKDRKKNRYFRTWGKRICSMADGIVLESLDDCPNNPIPLEWTSETDLRQKMDQQKIDYWGTYTNGGAGNHFYIQHGDEVMLYAHMQKSTLNPKLLITSTNPHPTIKAGEFLGLAGNSGNSSSPHLHIHSVQGTLPEPDNGPLRPITLKDAWAIHNKLVIDDPRKGLWSRINFRGIPEGNPKNSEQDCFLWPAKSIPEWPEIVYLGIYEYDYYSLLDTMKLRGFRPVWFEASSPGPSLGEDTRYNVIFRPATGVTYHHTYGLSGGEYQIEYDKWVGQKKYRLVHIDSYFSTMFGKVSYAPIFIKSPGPDFTAYHGKNEDEHKTLYKDLTENQGFVPVNISVVYSDIDRRRYYTALYDKRDVGKPYARTKLSLGQYKKLVTDNAKKGYQLVYINSYKQMVASKMVAIWYQNQPESYVEDHISAQKFEALLKTQRNKNRYLRAVTLTPADLLFSGGSYSAIWDT